MQKALLFITEQMTSFSAGSSSSPKNHEASIHGGFVIVVKT